MTGTPKSSVPFAIASWEPLSAQCPDPECLYEVASDIGGHPAEDWGVIGSAFRLHALEAHGGRMEVFLINNAVGGTDGD